MRKYSVIIPVYNRPVEIDELLDSLCKQTLVPFEILVIEDGSADKCEEIVKKYTGKIPVKYYYKENSGQGFSRNYGFEIAEGDYFIVFDSDCLIPENYFEIVDKYLNEYGLDAYGGPDKARGDFSSIQKAISYSMTSPVTTGGIRGHLKVKQFHPRSFNMGVSRKVYETVGGYIITRMGEDIEYSIRIIEAGFKTGLIEEAFVYHKRRTDFIQFAKQLRFFGRARINVSRFYPSELKVIHILPLLLFLGTFVWIIWSLFDLRILIIGCSLYLLFMIANFILSYRMFRNMKVSFLSVFASIIQLLSYGSGLCTEGIRKIFKG